MEHAKPLDYLPDHSKLVTEVPKPVDAEVGLHSLHDHVDVGARVGFVDGVLVEFDDAWMTKLDHSLDLLNCLQFVLFVGDIDDLHSHVGSQPDTLVHYAEAAAAERLP